MRRAWIALLPFLLAACHETQPPITSAPSPGQRASAPVGPHGYVYKVGHADGRPSEVRGVHIGEGTAVDLVAESTTLPPARPRRRMNLDQLNVALRQASGGFGWTRQQGNVEVDLFESLAATLGKPDYLQITIEDLEPSALFQKFLDDAARSVCARMLEHDLETARPEARVLLRHVRPTAEQDDPEAIDLNIRWLLSRIHTRRVPADSAALVGWRWQFEGLRFSGATSDQAWNAMCVALFTHPDFYTY